MENNNFSTNIDLLKLKGAFVRNIQGKETKKACIIIPIEDADLYQRIDEDLKVKGVSLSLAHFERKEVGKYGDTHLVKQSHSKSWNDAHTEEEKNNEPILGNSSPLQKKERIADVPDMALPEEDDDLPF
jgi:hypothetical protein